MSQESPTGQEIVDWWKENRFNEESDLVKSIDKALADARGDRAVDKLVVGMPISEFSKLRPKLPFGHRLYSWLYHFIEKIKSALFGPVVVYYPKTITAEGFENLKLLLKNLHFNYLLIPEGTVLQRLDSLRKLRSTDADEWVSTKEQTEARKTK
jgi:hypothetical protein